MKSAKLCRLSVDYSVEKTEKTNLLGNSWEHGIVAAIPHAE
jgi:hypothetical protein